MRNAIKWFDSRPRPAQLLMAAGGAAAFVIVLDLMNGFPALSRLFYPPINTPADVSFWSALIYALALVLGLPVAFLLWHWRDRNVRDQIENARKDVNLKEFQEVQRQAAGLFEADLPQHACRQLQIAALHQLRGFLRGEYGDGFRRPAFELLLSGHSDAMERSGIKSVLKWLNGKPPPDTIFIEIRDFIQKIRDDLDPVSKERIAIICSEWDTISGLGFPLTHRNFDLVDLQNMDFSGLEIYHSSFIGAWLGGSKFNKTRMHSTKIIGGNLIGSQFSDSELFRCRLEGASLDHADFGNSVLARAKLLGSSLTSAKMIETNFKGALFAGAKIDGIQLNSEQSIYVNPDFLSRSLSAAINAQQSGNLTKNGITLEGEKIFQDLVDNGPWAHTFDEQKYAEVRAAMELRRAVFENP